jgi:hypothetical protein
MPKIAEGDANKVWILPSEFTKALEGLGSSIHEIAGIPKQSGGPRTRVDMGSSEPVALATTDAALSSADKAVQDAIAEAERSANPGRNSEGAHMAEPPDDAAGDDAAEAPPAQ